MVEGKNEKKNMIIIHFVWLINTNTLNSENEQWIAKEQACICLLILFLYPAFLAIFRIMKQDAELLGWILTEA